MRSNRCQRCWCPHQAFHVNLIAEAEAQLHDEGSESEYSTSDESSTGTRRHPPHPHQMMRMCHLQARFILSFAVNFIHRDIWTPVKPSQRLAHNFGCCSPEWSQSPEYFGLSPHWPPASMILSMSSKMMKSFHNNSNNSQMPVDDASHRLLPFGHYGMLLALWKVALWPGAGFGTVLLSQTGGQSFVFWTFSTLSIVMDFWGAKEVAKAWVEETSCPGLRDGSYGGW